MGHKIVGWEQLEVKMILAEMEKRKDKHRGKWSVFI